MRVDGRDIDVTGSLLQPLTRRTSDLVRLAAALLFLAIVVAGTKITRYEWVSLEKSIAQILDPLSRTQSEVLHLIYGLTLVALPFAILIALIIARQARLLGACLGAALLAALPLSVHKLRLQAPDWDFDLSDRPGHGMWSFMHEPGWVAMLTAVLTVAGPWLGTRQRAWWWTLLLAYIPIHLMIDTVVPHRALLGLAVGWLVGALVILVVGTPALEVPLDGAVRALGRRGYVVADLTVVRPARRRGVSLLATATAPGNAALLELYGPHQRISGVLQQLWHAVRLQPDESPPLHASMRRVLEHRALMSIAVGEMANTTTIATAALDRGWTLYASRPIRGVPLIECADTTPVSAVWERLHTLHDQQISHGDLRTQDITVSGDAILFGGFDHAEYGATTAQLDSDVAQLLVTTAEVYDPESTVTAAMQVFGRDAVLSASRRLTKAAVPYRIRASVNEPATLINQVRGEVMQQTGTDEIQAATITRFSRSQLIQLVLLVALVYVAYPFLSAVPTFFVDLTRANWWWALAGLAVTALTYLGAAAALWACADGVVSWVRLSIMQVGNTFAATSTPAGLGGLALSTRFLQRSGLSAVRATAAVALQQTVQVIVHLTLLTGFSIAAGASSLLSTIVPNAQVLYLSGGAALGLLGTVLLVPRLRRWLTTAVHPKLKELSAALIDVIRQPKRLAVIVLGDAWTTLGAAVALWMSIEAFGGGVSFVTVAMVTMVFETLASAAPTPGGIGAVEAALIGGLAAFGVPAALGVPAVLLYRVLTCWIPVFAGWPVMRWLAQNDMI